MEPLLLIGEIDTPGILFDKEKNIFEISGKSLPENVVGFYMPILQWLDDYALDPNPKTILEIKLIYFNSSTSKILADMLTILEKIPKKAGKIVEIYWYYLADDDDMLESGQDYSEMFPFPFQFIPFKPESRKK